MRAALALLLSAGAAMAEAPLPDAMDCAEAEIVRFERDLARARSGRYKGLAPYVDARAIDVCGIGGIMICDRAEATETCQLELAARLETKRWEIIADLPEQVRSEGHWAEGLYSKVYALAKGSSAGDDCAGMGEAMAAWCEAREAARRLELAVEAYQIARDHGAVEPAFALGWAEESAPLRPRARATAEKNDD